MLKVFIILTFLMNCALAETYPSESTPVEKAEEVVQDIEIESKHTQDYRDLSRGSVMAGWQPLGTWIPSRKTLSYTHIFNKAWSLEFEYSWANINFPFWLVDIGEINEKRFSLHARRYFGNSFHLLLGAFRNELRVKVGNDILERMSNTSIDEFRVKGTGLTGGIGNRWQFSNGFTLGVDWVRLNVPLFDKKVENDILENIEDNSDASVVKNVINKVKNIPTTVLFGINLGYTF